MEIPFMKSQILLAMILFSVLALQCTFGQEKTFVPVAIAGQSAPGFTSTVKFQSISIRDFSLADTGEIAFTGYVSGPGVTFSSNNMALWAGTPGNLTLVARTCDPAAGATNGEVLRFLGPPNVDNAKGVGFLAIKEKPTDPNRFGEKENDTEIDKYVKKQLEKQIEEEECQVIGVRAAAGLILSAPVGLVGHVLNQLAIKSELAGPKFPTLSGKHYRVEYATNLPATSWSVLAALVDGTGAEVTVTDAGAMALAKRFYRVVRVD